MIKINESENGASYVLGGTHFWSFTFGNLFFLRSIISLLKMMIVRDIGKKIVYIRKAGV